MNTRTKRRGFFASVGAVLTAAALALSGAGVATAASQPVPTESDVVITKLAEVSPLGNAATGESINTDGYTPIDGVKYEAYLVPGTQSGGIHNILTNAGQAWVADQTLTTVNSSSIISAGSPKATGTTGADVNGAKKGQIVWQALAAGLYVVHEASTPAGVTAAGDFLLTVPLTDPTNKNAWLSTIYVYPKNAKIGAEKNVADKSALTVGSDVTWTISSDIPKNANPATTGLDDQYLAPTGFQIVDTLTDSQLALSGGVVSASNIVVKTTGTSDETLGQGTDSSSKDYYVTTDTSSPGQHKYSIVLNASGRAKLATAINADSSAKVTVAITTTVKTAAEISNTATVYPSQASITDPTKYPPYVTGGVTTKYGSYKVNKVSSKKVSSEPDPPLEGAVFKVYSTENAAKKADDTYLVKPDVDVAGYKKDDGTWTTQSDGTVAITGLRYTAFAYGNTITNEDDKQYYWLVEVTAPQGHQLLAAPVKFSVDEKSATNSTKLVDQKTDGSFVLPLTGGTGTLVLTIGGIAILAVVLLVARRRRNSQAAAE